MHVIERSSGDPNSQSVRYRVQGDGPVRAGGLSLAGAGHGHHGEFGPVELPRAQWLSSRFGTAPGSRGPETSGGSCLPPTEDGKKVTRDS